MRLIGHGFLDGSEGEALEPIKGAARAGRQLVTIARRLGLPSLPDTGIYQAAGREKMTRSQVAHDHIRARGFDDVKPAALVFEHFVHGPFISLAIALECAGPFQTLEAEGFAGLTAIYSASCDLARGRCARALVGAVGPPAQAALLALDSGPPAVRVVARWGPADSVGDAVERSLGLPVELERLDAGAALHGLGRIAEVLADPPVGHAITLLAAAADGRAMAMAFVRE